MNQIKNTYDIKKLGIILSIWAHPDDESYLAAGVMAAAVANGQKVICITATKGEAGSQNIEKWPPETLGEVREKELDNALAALGVDEHYWLDFKDGFCEKADKHEAVEKIKQYIKKFQPDTILTFGPEGLTGHSDHACVSHWVSEAVGNAAKPNIFHAVHTYGQYEKYLKQADEKLNIFFNIEKPPLVNEDQCAINFELPSSICEKKCDAVAAMPSQTEIFFKLFGRDYIRDAFSSEYFMEAK